ncbi:LysR family transcriptional regulator [Paramaledivibacter caminithermalis]|jgi:DNA-binding transcriptional LysR family regulator|uniref:DNA-binding transcriptional regulator, LysR family n=1 Tax=Paramaledivibacter caminithermalis (strain DSM 15212 / CIP 107654 / DViRD3) TaxID=1121301 RepID=A0A1M6QJE7_PARC5|nr:LysR family transcriptional regulator [Paramaledivibacter caminithermalis]SHK20399.1 DNA-binding transcriptional regulator, LysR family [Paramaledivibacter caminithermalis DSM 15212]
MDINFELYKVFYFAAKTMNFSKAAEKLFVSQSAVSQSIKLLEKRLNTKLFFRHTKNMKLTYEGKTLFKHIEQAFNFIRSGERALSEINNLTQGEIRIGASDTICKYFLLPYFKKFHEDYPNIKIHITNRPSPVCINLLESGSIDIAVVNLSNKYKYENLNVTPVKAIQDVFIAGENFSNLKNKAVKLKELEKYPILSLEKNSTTRKYFDELIKKNDVKILPEFELDSIDLLVEMTKIGLGISFVIEDAIKEELKNERIFTLNIKENIPSRSIGVVTHSKIPLPPAGREFIRMF